MFILLFLATLARRFVLKTVDLGRAGGKPVDGYPYIFRSLIVSILVAPQTRSQ